MINDATTDNNAGNIKAGALGVGRETGQAGFEELTELKSVSIRTGQRAGTFAFGGVR